MYGNVKNCLPTLYNDWHNIETRMVQHSIFSSHPSLTAAAVPDRLMLIGPYTTPHSFFVARSSVNATFYFSARTIYFRCHDFTAGVDDNGSGMAALLETVRLVSSLAGTCSSDTTIIFVAFDIHHTSGVRFAQIRIPRANNCFAIRLQRIYFVINEYVA